MNRFLIFFLLLIQTSWAWSDCRPRLRFNRRVFLNNANPTEANITVVKRQFDSCNYFITFSRGNSSTFDRIMTLQSNEEQYNIFKDASLQTVLKDLPTANSTEVISGNFTLNDFFNLHRISIFRPPQDILPAGRYRDRVRVSIFEGTFGSTTVRSHRRNLTVIHDIPKEIRLSLVDSGASFNAQDVTQNMDFGTLQTGESLSFDIMVQSNAGYDISMSSQNNGKLKHTVQPTQEVSYTLAVDGVNKDLSSSQSSPVSVATGSGLTAPGGDRKNVQVVIGGINNKMSGRYSDNITVTVTTTE